MRLYPTLMLMVFCLCLFESSQQAKKHSFSLQTSIIGVGLNNHLYMRKNPTAQYSWIHLPHSCCVTQIHIMPNGAILGVGTNKHLYIKKTLYSRWKHVPHSCCVNDVTTMKINGKQVIVATNGANFYTKKTLNARWRHAHSANGYGLSIAGAGRALFGVSPKHDVKVRAGLSGKWYGLPGSCDVKDIVFQKNTLYGVGTDNMMVEKRLPLFSASARGFKVLTNNFKSWKYHGKSTCCVKSIGIPSRPISTKIKIIGVGLNKNLYFKTSLKDSWTYVPKSGSVLPQGQTEL